MSLEDLDEIYRLYEVPLEKRFAELRKQLSRSRTQKPQKDTKFDQGSLGLNSYSYAKVVNNHYNIKLHDLGTSEYFPADEPDYNQCKLILQTDHFGYRLFDDAQIKRATATGEDGQEVYCYGEPKLEDGFDRGYGDPTNSKKRQALHFNRPASPTYLQEYIRVKEVSGSNPNKSMRVADNTRLSFLFRVKMDSLADTNGFACTLWNHYNDSSNNMRLAIDTTMRWTLEKGGVTYGTSASAGLVTGTDYELGFAWDNGGATDADKFKFYKNGVLQTTIAGGASVDTGTTDAIIGRRGETEGGYITGHLILAKVWTGVTLSASAYSRHFTNKLTTADIAYGKVATAETSVPRNL